MTSTPKNSKEAGGSAGSSQGGGFTRIRSGSLERLPSLRPKRDLTLGGVPKKTFSPTIPTSRRIKKEPGEGEGVPDGRRGEGEDPLRGRGRPSLDKKGGREQRKKVKKEIVTASSVFSMGPADRPMEGRTGFNSGTFGAETSKHSNFSSKNNDKRDLRFTNSVAVGDGDTEDEEAESVRGGTVAELFSDSLIPPVQLPLDYSKHVKQKAMPSTKTVKKIKQETEDVGEEAMDTSESKVVTFAKPPPPAEVKGHQITAAELFTPCENAKGKFLFIQLPDCLPISTATAEKGAHQPMDTEKSSRASSVMTTASAVTSEGEPETQRHCSLSDVPEGAIGKLRVHKSGKVKLTLGEVSMDVAIGTSCGFLQQLVSVRPSPPQPKMTVLGQLSHRLVCSPDFETMLERASREHRLESS